MDTLDRKPAGCLQASLKENEVTTPKDGAPSENPDSLHPS